MRTEKEILDEIKRLSDAWYRSIPCGKPHNHYFMDSNGKAHKKEVNCDILELCGHCKGQLTQRPERRLIKQLKWVLEGEQNEKS